MIRRIVRRWFICLGRCGDPPSSGVRSWCVSDDAVLKQNEGFTRELFPVVMFGGVVRDGGGLSGG